MTKPSMIYLIEQVWCDPMENNYFLAVGYKPLGFVYTETEAKEAIERGGVLLGRGWPLNYGSSIPMRRVVPIGVLNDPLPPPIADLDYQR